MSSPPPPASNNIVIIGGGVIGVSCAYYIATHPSAAAATKSTTITLLEPASIAAGASGKAGGLLALWAYPQCIVPLSFALHKELADKHDGANRWGYRAVACGRVSAVASLPLSEKATATTDVDGQAVSLQKRPPTATTTAGVPSDLDWLDADCVTAYEEMAGAGETAQVHPYQFTTALAALAEQHGVRIVRGTASGISFTADGSVQGVSYIPRPTAAAEQPGEPETQFLPAAKVVLAAGPWTASVYAPAPITSIRAHSVVIKREVSAYTLFTEITLPASSSTSGTKKHGKKRSGGEIVTPEIYARPDGTVYACGTGDSLVPLPRWVDQVQVDAERCQDVLDQVGGISGVLAEGEVVARQACYLPNVRGQREGPLIGETKHKGLILATGHTCWGIQNSAGTGKVVSEIVWEGRAKSAEVESLSPRRWGL